jgi:hypothetical protein
MNAAAAAAVDDDTISSMIMPLGRYTFSGLLQQQAVLCSKAVACEASASYARCDCCAKLPDSIAAYIAAHRHHW